MKYQLFLGSILGSILISTLSFAEIDPKCIRVAIENGNACDNLKVDFDFSHCGVAAPVSQAVQSVCVNQKAVAFVREQKEVYIATYQAPAQDGGQWKFLTLRKEMRRKYKTQPQISAVMSVAPTPPAAQVVTEDLMKKAEDLAAKTEENLKSSQAQMEKEQIEKKDEKKEVEKIEPPIKYNVFFDSYYSYNMNSPTPNTKPAEGSTQLNPTRTNKYRAFDGYSDQFTVALAMLRLQHEQDGATFLADIAFGQNTAAMLSYAESTQYIPQAYLKLKMSEDWNFYAGKLLTHMGLESPYAHENWNYSRSLLFTYAIPLSHTGMAFEWKVDPAFAASFYVYNNWAGMFEYNRTKNFGLRLNYDPNKDLNIRYNVIGGNELATVGDSVRLVHELSSTWMFSSAMGLQLEYVMGTENKAAAGADAAWSSALLGFLWKLEKGIFDARVEMYADSNGYTVDGGFGTAALNTQNLTELTLGYSWLVNSHAKTRFELRQDQSDKNVFRDASNTLTNTQLTGALAFTYEY